MNAPGPITVSWFPTAMPTGPALGEPETMTWRNFAGVFWHRREGEKDGPNFVPARFSLEPDGRHVRRLKRNLLARTAIALDCEASKTTGELPPSFAETVERIRGLGWAAIIYTSHSHRPEAPRYRIVLPLSVELDPELPAPEIVAGKLGLAGVLDRSKPGASSLFYLPSMSPAAAEDLHATEVIGGAAIEAAWVQEAGGAILEERQAEQDRIAALAHAEAERRRQARLAAGFCADDSVIERIRAHLDLEQVLLSHGYERRGTKFRHPNSSSGVFGADIRNFGGIDRFFSFNGTDPLHASNLPSWCTVTALDSFDAVVVLDYGGDRKKAMTELAVRFGLTKRAERKALAKLLFKMIREQAPQSEIEKQAFAEGMQLGLTKNEVCAVAAWAAQQATVRRAA